MSKLSLAALALLSMTISAESKSVLRSEFGDVGVRGAPCAVAARVNGAWDVVQGSCSMIKNARTNNTLVWIGQGRLLIVRDADEAGFAKLYRVAPETDELGFLGNAVADGNCWVGKTMRFCAK